MVVADLVFWHKLGSRRVIQSLFGTALGAPCTPNEAETAFFHTEIFFSPVSCYTHMSVLGHSCLVLHTHCLLLTVTFHRETVSSLRARIPLPCLLCLHKARVPERLMPTGHHAPCLQLLHLIKWCFLKPKELYTFHLPPSLLGAQSNKMPTPVFRTFHCPLRTTVPTGSCQSPFWTSLL